jgi:hypothetical protein
MTGKRVQFDEETWAALDLLARDNMADFQELADEAFRDLLAKHGRPLGLKAQLKGSLRADVKGDQNGGSRAPPSEQRRKVARPTKGGRKTPVRRRASAD